MFRLASFLLCLALIGHVRGQNVSRITILHIGDVHNRIEGATAAASMCVDNTTANNCYGGYMRLAQAVNNERNAERNPVLLFDAGDQFTGTLWDTVHKGKATAQMQNQLGLDAMVLGNHEFDYGPEVLAAYLKAANFPVLGCNVDASRSPALKGLIKPHAILSKAKIKIGVVGVVTADTAFLSNAGPDVTFSDPIKALPNCIANMKKENAVNFIIVLSHVGLDMDIQIADVPEVDMIIGGHSHTFMFGTNASTPGPQLTKTESALIDVSASPYPTWATKKVGGIRVPIVHAYYASRYLGNVTITFDAQGNLQSAAGVPLLLGPTGSSSAMTKDPAMVALVAEYAVPVVAAWTGKPGSTAGEMPQKQVGSYFCDALVRYLKTNTSITTSAVGPVFICLLNSGGLRAPLPSGPAGFGDVLASLPFSNYLTIKKVTGKTVLDSISYGVDGLGTPNGTGRLLQTAGLRYTYDSTKPTGQRVIKVEIVNPDNSTSAIEPSKTYNIIVNDFVARGGDGFSAIAKEPFVYQFGPNIDGIVSDDLVRYSPVAIQAGAEGRMVDCSTSGWSTLCGGNGVNPNGSSRSSSGSAAPGTPGASPTTRANSAAAAVRQVASMLLGAGLLAALL